MPQFPQYRPRRLRRTPALRRLVRETTVDVADLIQPCFVTTGSAVRRPIASMPGVFQTSVDELITDAANIAALGIPAILMFGIPDDKDDRGSSGWNDDGIVQQAVRALKREIPDLIVITDVCLCEYTSHGHCGVMHDGSVDNDATLELLARQAISHARAGADIIAPSDMMDGRVGAIRSALDAEGFQQVAILSYAAKYASAFYGPFREAAGSAPQTGDRKSYQMDPANADEALREVQLDIDEGADMIMVKPAHTCLDIIWRVKQATGYPVCAYHVSGEYAAIMAAGQLGWIDANRALEETLTSIRRAGADLIITYWATEFARRRRNGEL
jgi:porphobilinogen synthase